ncbi:MAG: FkbM family methyltransferase [Bacteroidota bacterium]|nr:FkbM family methyltransferase [Bacteroidota bacterium]
MKRTDRIKVDFIRNWKLPGRERLSRWFTPSEELKVNMRHGIVWFDAEDIAIYTSADNYIEWTILTTGTYEHEINKLIRISLKPGNNALDIGGNIGLQSIRMSQCVGTDGKVYAFEPITYLQEKFEKNISLNCISNVTLFPYALSDQAEETDFKINRNKWNQGTFSLTDDGEGAEIQHVVVKIADDMPEIQTLSSLSLIKIDVEGFEYHVLLGLKHTLLIHKPRIIFEYDHNYWINATHTITDCYSFLRSLAYTVYQITPVGCELVTTAENIVSGNLFCVPSHEG